MAEQGVLRDTVVDAARKCIDIIDAFAHKDALAKEVLVNVRDGVGVQVQPAPAGIDAGEPGEADAAWMHFHTGLQHGIARDDAVLVVEHGAVQRVRQGADQPASGARRDDGVGIQGDHKAGGTQQACDLSGGALGHKGGIGGAAQVPVELVQLAALALPAHPDALGLIPQTPAMQQDKALHRRCIVTAVGAGIARVEGRDRLVGIGQQARVLGARLAVGVAEIAQQREKEPRLRIAQIVHLQLLDQMVHVAVAADQRGHSHQRLVLGGDRLLEFELGQAIGRRYLGDDAIHQAARGDQHWRDEHQDGDDQGDGGERLVPGNTGGRRYSHGGQRIEGQGHQGYGAQIQRRGVPAGPAAQAFARAGPVAEHRLQGLAAGTDQVGADVARGLDGISDLSGGLRLGYSRRGHPSLLPVRFQREFLDLLPVQIAGLEIHAGIETGGVLAQDRLVRADLLEKGLPVGIRDGAQPRDDVGHHGRGTVALRARGARLDQRGQVGRVRWGQHIRQGVGQGLHQSIAQQDRERPELAHGEREVLLERHQHRRDDIQMQVIVLAGEQVAGQPIDARQAGQRTLSQER